MSGDPWSIDPVDTLGRAPRYPVHKPTQFDHEIVVPEVEPERILDDVARRQAKTSVIVEAYVTGVVNAVSERMERAAEAMLTDPNGWGILAVESWNGLDFTVRVWLHPDVPFGEIQHHKVYSIDDYIYTDPVLSEGGGRLIE